MNTILIENVSLNLDTNGTQFLLCEKPNLRDMQELQLRVKNTTDLTLTLDTEFRSKDQQVLIISFDILPYTDVMIPINLDYLNSQKLFPKRTKGRLRMMVNGSPINKKDVSEIYLSSRACHKERKIELIQVALSSINSEGKIYNPECLVDSFGQWNKKDWLGKTTSESNLKEVLQAKLNLVEANTSKLYTSGFFSVKKDSGKWFLIDPNGNPFFSVGLDCIGPSSECRVEPVQPYLPVGYRKEESINFPSRNLIRLFGDDWYKKWQSLITYYLQEWKINTIGNWSDLNFIKNANIPYVIPLDSVGEYSFPDTKEKIFRDFPDVFSPEYEENAKLYAKSILPFLDDSLLIGYFMRNEPEWAFEYEICLAEELLKKVEFTYTKKKMIEFFEERYQVVEDFSFAWGVETESIASFFSKIYDSDQLNMQAKSDLQDFSKKMVQQYVSIPAKEIKAIDANHLNLGMRYAYVANENIIAGFENFDVFSINCYQEDPTDKIQQVAELTDLPVMIGEFHFGGLDKGLTATGIKGCLTQEDRGKAYSFYFERAAAHSHFIGAHYFALYDQSCLGRFDGENYQFGFLDVCSLPHQEFIDAQGVDPIKLLKIHSTGISTAEPPKLIPPIYC